MLLKRSKLKNVVLPYGRSGAFGIKGQGAETLLERFRSFSVYNVASTCTVTVGPNKVIVPVGVTITWDAPDENNVINAYNTGAFAVECINCIVAGTIA